MKNTGTLVQAPLVPYDDGDNYPTHEDTYGKGGHRTVASLTERDDIPEEHRKAGMEVWVVAEGKKYRLEDDLGTWSVTDESSLRDDLASIVAGKGAALVSMEGGGSVEAEFAAVTAALGVINANSWVTLARLANGILSADAAGRLKMADGYITLAKILDGIFTADAAGRAKFADAFLSFAKLDPAALASQAEAEAGASALKLMTPQRVAQAIAALPGLPKLYLDNTIGAAFATLATFGAAGAWSAWTQVDITARIGAIYSGALANVRAVTVYSTLAMQAGPGPVNQQSKVAFSGNNSAAQDSARQQRIAIGLSGADSARAADHCELVVPVSVSASSIYIYYSTRRLDGDYAAEDWSGYITAVQTS